MTDYQDRLRRLEQALSDIQTTLLTPADLKQQAACDAIAEGRLNDALACYADAMVHYRGAEEKLRMLGHAEVNRKSTIASEVAIYERRDRFLAWTTQSIRACDAGEREARSKQRQAQAILDMARQQLTEGNLDEARRQIAQAQELDVALRDQIDALEAGIRQIEAENRQDRRYGWIRWIAIILVVLACIAFAIGIMQLLYPPL